MIYTTIMILLLASVAPFLFIDLHDGNPKLGFYGKTGIACYIIVILLLFQQYFNHIGLTNNVEIIKEIVTTKVINKGKS